MKFIIKKNILLEALINTSKAISQKNLIPILTGIKFDLKKDGLYLYASDSDISIRSFIPSDDIIEIIETGSVVIGGKYIETPRGVCNSRAPNAPYAAGIGASIMTTRAVCRRHRRALKI